MTSVASPEAYLRTLLEEIDGLGMWADELLRRMAEVDLHVVYGWQLHETLTESGTQPTSSGAARTTE